MLGETINNARHTTRLRLGAVGDAVQAPHPLLSGEHAEKQLGGELGVVAAQRTGVHRLAQIGRQAAQHLAGTPA